MRLPNAFAVGHSATHFDDELLVAVTKPGRERVGCLCIVIDTELAAERHCRLRPRGIAKRPACDTGFMHTLVPDVAVAGIPKPVPVISETFLVEGTQRRRAKEQIPIQPGRRWGIRRMADRRTQLVTQRLAHVDLADQSLLERSDRLDLERPAPMLRSHLHDALGLALHLDHPHAFVDVVAGGLFAVDVLARLHRPDSGERVPVVRSRNRNRLHLRIGEHLPHIFEFRGFFQVLS